MQFKRKQVDRIIGYSSLGLLGLMGLALLVPIVPPAQAMDLAEGQSFATVSTRAQVSLQSVISLALQNRVDVDIVPKGNGTFSSATAKMDVATNNSTGYGIYLGTFDKSQNLTLYGNKDATIAPVTEPVDVANFPINRWGYSLVDIANSNTEDAKYRAVPGETTQVRNVTTTDPSVGRKDSYELSFGAKADTTLSAGTYTNQIIVSVVANPRQIQGLGDLLYMQEMTPAVCQMLKDLPAEQQTGQLIDQRDGKSYWVSYLADGNCWMTQNLALDLSTEKALTPNDTDITSNWTPMYDTFTSATAPGFSDRGHSWNLGQYVLAVPERAQDCTPAVGEGLEQCSDFQLVDESWNYMDVANGEWNGYEGLVTVNQGLKLYDAHYLVGNYYQFGAMTAGTGEKLNSGIAAGSICPKGWRLPTTYRDSGDYYKLLVQYGVSSQLVGTGSSSNPITAGNTYHAVGSPLYLVRNGYISNDHEQEVFKGLMGAGEFGTLGSPSTARVGATFYVLHILQNSMSTYSSWGVQSGMAMRCVAR